MLLDEDDNFDADVQHLYAEALSTDTPLYHSPSESIQSTTAQEQQVLVTLEETFKDALDGHYLLPSELVILAAKLGHTATICRYIEEHRNKLTFEDRKLYTQAMWWAIEHRPRNLLHEQIFWMLLDAGADIDMSVGPHETPLIWAIRHQSKTKFDVLLARGAKLTLGDPLLVAASGRSYFVEVLLSKGIGSVDTLIMALYRAAISGRSKNISLLLTALARLTNVNNTDVMNAGICDAFDAAVAAGTESAVKTFLRHGIQVDAKDGQGHTALATAAFHGQTEIVELLLKRGADVNAVNDAGISPLMMAVVGRNRFTVSILLDVEGIDLNVHNKSGYTAEKLAEARGYHYIAGLIRYAAAGRSDLLSSRVGAGFFARPDSQSSESSSVRLIR